MISEYSIIRMRLLENWAIQLEIDNKELESKNAELEKRVRELEEFKKQVKVEIGDEHYYEILKLLKEVEK